MYTTLTKNRISWRSFQLLLTTLKSVPAKIYNSMLLDRLRPQIDAILRRN